MDIEILKEYHKEYSSVEEKYSIKTTYFKYVSLFKLDTKKINYAFNGYSDEGGTGIVIFILYHLFIVTPAIVLNIIFGFWLGFAILFIVEAIVLKIYNYVYRELYDDLPDAEEEVKDLIKLKSLNKKVIQRYSIDNNELIIEKQKDKENEK